VFIRTCIIVPGKAAFAAMMPRPFFEMSTILTFWRSNDKGLTLCTIASDPRTESRLGSFALLVRFSLPNKMKHELRPNRFSEPFAAYVAVEQMRIDDRKAFRRQSALDVPY